MIRRAISLHKKIASKVISNFKRCLAIAGNQGVLIDSRCSIGYGSRISCTDGGQLEIGANTSCAERVELISRGGCIEIGQNVFIGSGVIIVSTKNIEIGDDTQIAEYVVIRDQDHETTARPIRTAGFRTAPIKIGRDCWLGAKVTVLSGSNIGDGAVIGAHSVVRGEIPPYSLAAGCPAKVVKQLPQT